ncbi:hypothetical protein ACOMHN_057217 [Nucella lapillus]
MQDGRLPKDILYGELATGSRPTGRPALRYKDVCKRDFKAGGIAPANFEALAADRSSWQLATIKTAEQWREEKWEKRKARRRQRAESAPSDDTVYTCNNCSRTCRSRIELHSHSGAAVPPKTEFHGAISILFRDRRMPKTMYVCGVTLE